MDTPEGQRREALAAEANQQALGTSAGASVGLFVEHHAKRFQATTGFSSEQATLNEEVIGLLRLRASWGERSRVL